MDELQRAAADRWQRLVASGMPREEATAEAQSWLESQRAQLGGAGAGEVAGPSIGPADPTARARESISSLRTPGGGLGAIDAGASGFTSGFSDEVRAGFQSIPSLVPGGETPREAFARNIAEERQGLQSFRGEHPVVSGAANLGGAIQQGMVMAPVVGARVAAAGTKGILGLAGAEGAVTAVGQAEGGVDRLKAAPVGFGAGVAGGGFTLGLGSLLKKAGGTAMDFLNLRPSTEAVPGVGGMASRAEQRLSDALPDDLDPLGARLQASDRPLSVMDVSENARSLARSARSLEGEGREKLAQFLGNRVEGQEARVLDDALRLSGLGERSSIIESTQEIVARRAADATPLYEAAYERSVRQDVLGDVLDDSAFRDAYERGVRIAKRERVTLPSLDALAEGAEVPVQAIDYMKRGMDDLIDVGSRSSGGMGRQEARGLRTTLRGVLERVDEAVPEYAEARAAFAGESRMLDALEQGRDLWKMDPVEARQVIDGLSEGEREMFVRGGVESLAERVEDASATFDITKRRPLADRTRDRTRLRLLFPDDEAFDQFAQGLSDEAQIAATNRFVVGGSQTADKLAGLAEFAGVDVGDVAAMASGNVPSLVSRMAQRTVLGQRNKFMGRLGEELTPSLTATGDDAVVVLDRIARLRQGVGRELSVQDAAAAIGGASVGAAVVAPDPEPRRRLGGR